MERRETKIPTLEELYDRFSGVIYGHCLRILCNKADAEDALQEAFMKAYIALPKLRNASGYTPWLYRIATNVCLDTLRSKKRKQYQSYELTGNEPTLTMDLGELVIARQTLEKLAKNLDNRDMSIVIDYFVTGMDQSKVAESLGVTRRTVNKRLSRIRHQMSRIISREKSNV